MNIIKHYPKDDITIVWQASKCIHCANCFRGLPSVFDPRVQPWVRPEGASKEEILAQVAKCPSGALSIEK